MKTIYILIITTLFSFSVLADGGWRKDEKEVKVYISNKEDAEKLCNLRLSGDIYKNYAILYVVPSELDKIENLGLDYEVIIPNLNEFYKDFWKKRTSYHSYEEIIDLMDSLVDAFPEICMKTVYGTSYGSRELSALKISDNVEVDENEAEVMFDGGIHGNEVGASENCIRFARDLCCDYNNDEEITDLINNREIWIYVMVNPDGRVNNTRENNNGVDLNRDWGYMWDGWDNSSGAYSQVESKALRSCSFNNQFVIHTSYHSGTEYVSYPWSYRTDTCPDRSHIDYLAALYSESSGYPYLDYGQGSIGMYPINGSTKDSNYGIMGSVTWSMEISYDKHPPESQIMKYYNYNKPAMISMIEYAGYGLNGKVTDAETDEPVAAAVFVDDYYPTYTDPEVGDYHKYVGPGTYSITFKANGYKSKTFENITVDSNNSLTTTDVELHPEYGHYIYRTISCRIPENNPEDKADTPAIIGKSDSRNYSIGVHGWIVVDMLSPIRIGPAKEITVHEGDFDPESYTCYISYSMDGPWTSLGQGTGTTKFDFPEDAGDSTRYIKIQDDGDGLPEVTGAGFDLDAISVIDQSDAIVLKPGKIRIIDSAGGNGNNHIDPGETVDLIIPLTNEGEYTAEQTFAKIKPDPFYSGADKDSAYYGDIQIGDTASGTFTITVSSYTPPGHPLIVILTANSNDGFYKESYTLTFYVGQIPLLIVDLDENSNSAPAFEACCNNLDINYQLLDTFPDNYSFYDRIFVCLGTRDSNHVLTNDEGQWLADYLLDEGLLYMEGGDTWFNDPQTPVHPYFHIEGLGNGSGDLDTIAGLPGTFTNEMTFSFNGDNISIDHINPFDESFTIMHNIDPEYGCAIAYDAISYKTIGSSFEFGGLENGEFPSTRDELFQRYLDFFDGLYTSVAQHHRNNKLIGFLDIYPNPFNSNTSIKYSLNTNTHIQIIVYNINGKKVNTLFNGFKEKGKHEIVWNGLDQKGNRLPDGMYFFTLETEKNIKTKRLIIKSN